MFTEVKKAKKEHKCAARFDCTIKPGENYIDEIITPWDRIPDDVDDEGRTTYSPAGEWTHMRYHGGCRDEAEWVML